MEGSGGEPQPQEGDHSAQDELAEGEGQQELTAASVNRNGVGGGRTD